MPAGAPPLAAAGGEHTLADSAGRAVSSGDAEFRLFADRLQIASRSQAPFDIEFLDVDSVRSSDFEIELSLWPEGKLLLRKLGRLWESFAAALSDARDDAALHGVLAHGLAERARFEGAVVGEEPPSPAWLRVYPTHLAAVPRGGLPFQIPWGAVEEIRLEESSYSILFRSGSETRRIGRLGRRTEAFQRACEEARREQQERIVLAVTPHLPVLPPIASRRLLAGFQDGLGVAQSVLDAAAPGAFHRLLERVSSAERLERAKNLVASAVPGEARVGIVELLDENEGGEDAQEKAAPTLGENLAAFLLVPIASAPAVALELLCGPAAATYLFRIPEGNASAGLSSINADLQAIHFRRAVLALTETRAAGPEGRPYRLALRAVPAVFRLRAATVGRLIHGRGDFDAALQKALAGVDAG